MAVKTGAHRYHFDECTDFRGDGSMLPCALDGGRAEMFVDTLDQGGSRGPVELW